MQYISDRKQIFILGPDNKRLLRDSIKSSEYIYFDPELGNIPLNFRILFFSFFYFILLFTIKSSFVSLSKSAYLTALIRANTIEIVITSIDNSIHFSRAASILSKKLRFIVIQNGAKFDFSSRKTGNKLEKLFFPELLCFSQNEKNNFLKANTDVGKFHIVGSLYEMAFRDQSKLYKQFINNSHETTYDLCLISENYTNFNKIYSGIEEAYGKIAEFCERYCLENNLKLIVALKNKPGRINKKRESEINYLSRFIDINNSKLSFSENKVWWSAYDITLKSKLILGMGSTLLLESAARGNKVLICDYYEPPWSMGAKSPLALEDLNHSYTKFENVVTKILAQSKSKYLDERREQIDFLMTENNFNSVKECINSILNLKQ